MKERTVCLTLLVALGCDRWEDRDPPREQEAARVQPYAVTDRLVPGTPYLGGNLDFALQEAGVGKFLWRMVRLSQMPVRYRIGSGLPYVGLTENGPYTFGIRFPDTLREVTDGWIDEEGFYFANVIELGGALYLSAYELAERNDALAILTSGYGEVSYFPAVLPRFMEDHYYPHAENAGSAWREVHRRRVAKAE